MRLFLYSTTACHLCENARDMLWPLLEKYPIRLQEIDIADSDELLERYGVRIPVLRFADGEEELGWPFDSAQLQDFLIHGAASAK